MNRKLGELNRGGSSVRVGSVGTISALMSKELETSSSSSRRNSQSAPVAVSCGERTLKLRKSMDEVHKTGTRGNHTKQRNPENARQTRGQHHDRILVLGLATPKLQRQKVSLEEARSSRTSPEFNCKTRSHKRTHHMPMLGSEDKTSSKRDKSAWKVNLVEVVDTNCGIPAGPLSSKLKKLGFAKLSQSII